MQAVIIVHLVAFVEAPVVERAHNVQVLMRQRCLALVEEIHAAIVGLGEVVKVLIFNVNELLAVDVLVGSIGLSRPRLARGDVDFKGFVRLPDVRQILRLEIEVAGIEASVLVRTFETACG